MAETQTVIIDFQADFTQLEEAITTLEKAGKVDSALAAQFKKANQEIKAQGDAFNKVSQSANKETQSLSKLHQLLQQFPKTGMNRFLLQVGNELATAGIKAEDFFKKTNKEIKPTEDKVKSFRTELRELREEMVRVAQTSGVLSDEYKKLQRRAGELDDTIKDVGSDIANAGSDTRGIDNVVGSISALAGGFSAVQGAAALFGDESEELQKTLLKVNAAMALSTGLQQLLNATTKQGSLTRLADVTATYSQIAAQKIYTFVTGKSTAATKAFKVALAATGIGAAVLLILTLITALKDKNEVLEKTNKLLDEQRKKYEDYAETLDIATRTRLANAELEGKGEEELARITESSLIRKKAALAESNRLLVEQRTTLAELLAKIKTFSSGSKDVEEALSNINKQIEENNKQQRELNAQQLEVGTREFIRQQEERTKAVEEAERKRKEAADKALEAARKRRAAEFADFKAGIELQLLAVEKGSRQELELKKKLANAELLIDLEAENLTLNQRKLLIQQFFKDKKDLEKNYNKEVLALANENERNILQAALTNLNLSEEEKLATKIEFLQLSADAEIQEAEGNASKILLINKQLNADIAAAKVESIRKSAEDEARLTSARGGGARRALETVAANEKLKQDIRINAIRQLGQIEVAAIDKQIIANREANNVIGADHRQLEIEYEELLDKRLQATTDTTKKITDIEKAGNDERKANDIARIQSTVAALREIGSILTEIQSNEQAAAEHAITAQRRRIDELLEAGAITEKEAARRNKKIDAEEREVKNRAARQQKQLAVFNAVLMIPQAFLSGLTAPPPIGGPIYAAILAGLAAAQAAVIASRPVPKFATGKKGSYSGIGEVGEVGAELIQRGDGSMEVATKRTLVYLGPKDKVFTASETKQMMPFVNKEAIEHTSKQENINYDKIAQAIIRGYKPSPGTNINIDKDGITTWTTDQLERVHYHQKYYSSK